MLLAAVAASCQRGTDTPATASPTHPAASAVQQAVRLRAADAGAAVQLMVGQTLRVELDTSPASGYAWELDGDLPPGLSIETDPGAGPLQSKMPGPAAGTHQIWNFRATRPGRVRLRFLYRRAWERADQAARSAAFEVGVRPQS
ncbi:hypothetical protein ABB29_00700 [Pseudoxanthomonas dokdonensis]|uniref:Proteinase inhibitor I42 chagasin domain-containing protein n=1 Tax=Pseudoxanthomonas dokdonensis TaxID=344882 RepID=A0A0R0CZJ7_9GAMM|nr:hypothetical protein ABB29_00700 [Pseudoxanthomonas dokdonensis]